MPLHDAYCNIRYLTLITTSPVKSSKTTSRWAQVLVYLLVCYIVVSPQMDTPGHHHKAVTQAPPQHHQACDSQGFQNMSTKIT